MKFPYCDALKATLLLASASYLADAEAHVRQRYFLSSLSDSSVGQESLVAWPSGKAVKVSFHSFSGNVGNGTTATTIDAGAARSLVGDALGQWLGTAGVTLFGGLTPSISMDLDGGLPHLISSACETTASGGIDGVNNFVFTSKLDLSCASSLTSGTGVIGLTKLQFQPSSGEIVEADIQFDDTEFLFKTSGPNVLSPAPGSPKEIVLKDVIVHELGHFFGLDHSSVRDASMLFAIAENLRTTKIDDQMGIMSLYPPAGAESAVGGLRGSVTSSSGSPVFGAVVFLMNARTLAMEASELTDVNGAFEFCSVPAGAHLAFVARYKPFGTNIHEYYSGTGDGTTTRDSAGCFNPGCTLMSSDLKHVFYSEGGSGASYTLKVVHVAPGASSAFLNLVASTTETSFSPTLEGTPLIFEQPRVARLSQSRIPIEGAGNLGTDVYLFQAPPTGNVQLRTAALQLFTRLKLNLRIIHQATQTEVTDLLCPVSPGSGEAFDEPTVNDPSVDIANARDPWLNCTGLVPGDAYIARVSGTGLSCRQVPGNSSSCLSSGSEAASIDLPYYMISVFETGRLGDLGLGETLGGQSLAATSYQNLPTCGSKSMAVSVAAKKKKGGCCGSLGSVPGGPNGPKSGLLALLLSPVLWFAFYWSVTNARRRSFRL